MIMITGNQKFFEKANSNQINARASNYAEKPISMHTILKELTMLPVI